MKKIFALLVVLNLVLSVSAFAQKKATTVTATAKASGMKIGIGVESLPAINLLFTPTPGVGIAGMKFAGDSFAGSVGLIFQSGSFGGASGTTMGLNGKFTFNLTGGAIPTHAGAALYYMSSPNPLNTNQTISGFTISGVYGAETTIADNLNIGFDIYPINFTSYSIANTSGTSLSLLSGTVFAYYMF